MFEVFGKPVAELFVVFLSATILKIYFGTFFIQYSQQRRSLFWWLGYVVWQIIISRINVLPGYINVLISLIFVTMIAITAYEGQLLQKVVFSVLINAIWMLIEFLIGYLFILSGMHIYYNMPQFLGSLLSKLLTLLFIIGLNRFYKNENIRNLSKKNNIILLLIPIGSMFVVYNIFVLSVELENQKHIRGSLASSILVLIINIVIFKLYLKLSKEKELQRYNTVYEKQLELCNQHMIEKEAIMMDFRNARHDMKQHFIVLMEMLDNNENALATEYLSKLVDMNLLNNIEISKTDNIVVDSLINAKYSTALKMNIRFDVDIHIPMQLPFESADVSVLIGNILDNAIEASAELPEEKRHIRYFMKYETNILIITVINAFSGRINKNKNGTIITCKEMPENHGIGLDSVRKVADKYHGSVVIEIEENTFIIKIILCDIPPKLHKTS